MDFRGFLGIFRELMECGGILKDLSGFYGILQDFKEFKEIWRGL